MVQGTQRRRGPVEGEHLIGVDADRSRRPGVPMEEAPYVRGPDRPLAPQKEPPKPFHRAGLDGPTPVYGTAQPPRGLSGSLRAAAYRVPEHYARHWMALLLADRVDVVEERVRGRKLPLMAVAALAVWGVSRLVR